MNTISSKDFSRKFDSNKIKQFRNKEIKKWQWIVLLCCFLMQMTAYSVAINLSSMFMANDWNIWLDKNQSLASLTFTIGAVGSALLGPFIAKLFTKNINQKIIYSIGISLAVFGFFLPGLNSIIPAESRNVAGSAVILYSGYLISQIGIMIFSAIGINNLISKWWPAEKRGFALGLAFTGGSVGNIWMQQLLKFLKNHFGVNNINVYIIFSVITLTLGLGAAIIACKKPTPPNVFELNDITKTKSSIICVGCNNTVNKNSHNHNKDLDASFLTTRKYPLYWLLAIGFLIINMGVVHVSMAPSFIGQKSQALQTTGLTIFGIFCIIGNFGGGIVNQKLGPQRSIALAGLMQVCAITCLAFAMKNPDLVYVYYILCGLSVYLYTSTPAFVAGKLFGTKSSNSHIGILGIFLALGFAITNSIIGFITGNFDASNQTNIVGVTVNGNLQGLIIYAALCMGLGSAIVSFCCWVISRKGIKGLNEYSPTKYTRIIVWKHSFLIWVYSTWIYLTGKDFRINNPRKVSKWKKYIKKDKEYNTLFQYINNLSPILKEQRLSSIETEILAYISMNKIITLTELKNNFYKISDDLINKIINSSLIKKIELNQGCTVLELSDEAKSKLSIIKLENKITKANREIEITLKKIETKADKKVAKYTKKLQQAQVITIKSKKQEKLAEISNDKVKKIQAKLDKLNNSVNYNNEWILYKKTYSLLSDKLNAEALKNKLEINKQEEIKKWQKKIFIANYIKNFDMNKQIEGHNLLINYYNDQKTHCDLLLDKAIGNIFERKFNRVNQIKNREEIKFNNLLAKETKIFSNKPKFLESLKNEQIDQLEVIKTNSNDLYELNKYANDSLDAIDQLVK